MSPTRIIIDKFSDLVPQIMGVKVGESYFFALSSHYGLNYLQD